MTGKDEPPSEEGTTQDENSSTDELAIDRYKNQQLKLSSDVSIDNKLIINADEIEAPELFDAFVAGYESAQSDQTEEPLEDITEEELKSRFVEWVKEYAPGTFV